jgi:hypothetical protein
VRIKINGLLFEKPTIRGEKGSVMYALFVETSSDHQTDA